jgi:hypothetical protein
VGVFRGGSAFDAGAALMPLDQLQNWPTWATKRRYFTSVCAPRRRESPRSTTFKGPVQRLRQRCRVLRPSLLASGRTTTNWPC